MAEPWDDVIAGRSRWAVVHGECVEVMRRMPPNSVDAVICDPPYGLEFMGHEWDRLDGDVVEDPAAEGGFQDGSGGNPYSRSRIRYGRGDWQAGGGFSKPGIGDRKTEWPSYSATGRHGAANPTCATCGGRLRGKKKCACPEPIGKRRDPANEALPSDTTSSGMARQMNAMQAWHMRWTREALRVLKPGGHLLAMSGTRTVHRLACAAEDAGFEIRDQIDWYYLNGFPKNLDVSKAVDAALGKPRPNRVGVGHNERNVDTFQGSTDACATCGLPFFSGSPCKCDRPDQVPNTAEGAKWKGYGTALKPAHEPIIVARKPLDRTVAENVLRHGTGAINVDACRVAAMPWNRATESIHDLRGAAYADPERKASIPSGPQTGNASGRWPPNVLLGHGQKCHPIGHGTARPGDADGLERCEAWECSEGCPVAAFNRQVGDRPSGGNLTGNEPSPPMRHTYAGSQDPGQFRNRSWESYDDDGPASRMLPQIAWTDIDDVGIFYAPKTSAAERNAGLAGSEPVSSHGATLREIENSLKAGANSRGNTHPTVKPVRLGIWLSNLVGSPNGVLLDPFAGSGSFGMAARLAGFRWIGIEMSPAYVDLARARVAYADEHPFALRQTIALKENPAAKSKSILDFAGDRP